MNENAELIKYLDIAENVYENMYEKYQITDNPVTNLNRVMAEIRKEAEQNDLKLKYTKIDFEECLTKPLSEREIKVDLSLLPRLSIEMNLFYGSLILLEILVCKKSS